MQTLTKNDISPDDLYRLFEVAFDSISAFKHDALSPVSAAKYAVEVLEEISFDPQNDLFQPAISLLNTSTKHLHRSIQTLNMYAPYSFLDGKSVSARFSQFAANPHELFHEISREFPQLDITIQSHAKNIFLIYPHCALYCIFLELLTNCHKHGSKKVEFSWRLTEDFLICTISDDGPGLPNLPNSYDVEMSDLSRQFAKIGRDRRLSGQREPQGLRLLSRLAYKSQGVLKFKNSSLGGNQTEISLKPLGIWASSEYKLLQENSRLQSS
nr:ATP-binding protein [uncultured Cohaesibacter sp.]